MATQLFGRADSALINAAYKASAANTPKDLAPIHARMAAAYKVDIDSTAKLWKKGIKETGKAAVRLSEQVKLNKMGREEVSEWKNPEGSGAFTHFDNNGNQTDVGMGSHEDILKTVRQGLVYNSLLGGSTEDKKTRKANRTQLKKIRDNVRASTKGFLVIKETAQAMIESDSYNPAASKGNGQLFLHALLSNGKPLKGGQRAVMGWTQEGVMTFAFTDKDGNAIEDGFGKAMTLQHGEIDALLTPNYDEGRTAIGGAILGAAKDGAKGLPRDPVVLNNLVKNTVKTPAQFSDLSNWTGANIEATLADKLHGIKFDGSGEAVNDETELSELIFSNLDVTQWDTIPEGEEASDGVIDGRDFANPENYEKLLSAILNPKDPAFDLGLSNQILAMHFGESADKLHGPMLDRYNKSKNAGGGGGGGGGGKTTNTIELPWGTFNNPSTFGNSKAKYTTQLANVNRIADKKRVVDGENTYEWDTADQKYKQTRLGENELEEDTRYTQAELMGIVSPYYGNVPSDFNFGGRTESSVPAAAPVLENLTININDKLIPIKEIDAGAYTFIDGKPYTKKQFFKAIQSKRLSQKQVEEGGKIAQQLQNKRG